MRVLEDHALPDWQALPQIGATDSSLGVPQSSPFPASNVTAPTVHAVGPLNRRMSAVQRAAANQVIEGPESVPTEPSPTWTTRPGFLSGTSSLRIGRMLPGRCLQ